MMRISFVLVLIFLLMPSLSFAATDIYYSVGTNASDLMNGPVSVSIDSGVAVFNVSQPDKIGVGDKITYVGNVSFISGRINSTAYDVVTAKGAVPLDVSDLIVYNITRAFNSLDDAVDAVDGGDCANDFNHLDTSNLTEGNYTLNIACYGDGADTDAVVVDGWTTGVDNYIRIYTPVNSSEVGVSQRHDGKWDAGKYILDITGDECIYPRTDYIKINGLQLKTDGPFAIYNSIYDVNGLEISECIINANNGIYINGPFATIKIWNSLLYGTIAAGSEGIYCFNATNFYVYNCVVYGFEDGIERDAGNVTVINSVIFNNTDDFDGIFTNISFCASDDGDGTNNQTPNNWSDVFVNYHNGDFHLKVGSVLINNGTNLSSNFTNDIDGETRMGAWDIGADEYFPADTISPNVTSVSDSPDPQGLGENVTITATVVDNVGIGSIFVGITLPGGTEMNYTMTNQSSIYTYNYLNYINGTYNYTIYASDFSGNLNSSESGTFEIYSDVYIHVKTLKDIYGANEIVNITDPFEFDLSYIDIGEEDASVLDVDKKDANEKYIISEIFYFISNFFIDLDLFGSTQSITGMDVYETSHNNIIVQEDINVTMLTDFETGENTNGLIGGGTGYFRHQNGSDIHLPVVSLGAVGTDYCVEYATAAWEIASAGDHPQSFYMDNPTLRTNIEEADNATRMSAWVKVPINFIQGHDRDFHFGTYTRDPSTPVVPGVTAGIHYYHIFNIPGSNYWTKIIANEHPQARSGDNDEIGNNPTAPGWNYYDGFTRFYFHTKGGIYPTPGTWSFFIDEVKFYDVAEPEDVQNVTSISCSYFGDGHFQINWHGDLRDEPNSHHYEVRYSSSPITNANYASATLAPGCSDVTIVDPLDSYCYNWMSADFTIPIISGTAYFAVKDLDSASPYVSKIDYPLTFSNVPPIRSNGQPIGNLPQGTISINLSLSTHEQAVCRYSNISGMNYTDMTDIFQNTNSTTHSTPISGLSDGNSYNYYVRCNNTLGAYNPDDFNITFSVPVLNMHLTNPQDNHATNIDDIIFVCHANATTTIENITLYTNVSVWAVEYTNSTGSQITHTINNIPDGTYEWNCRACNNESNCSFGYDNYTFKIDSTPPVSSNIQSAPLTESAIITWSTNELSDSVVKYGMVPGSYTNTENTSYEVTTHSINLFGLINNQTYYFVVNSTDQLNNSAQSAEQSFTTNYENSTLLIDFGNSEANNVYGLVDWNTAIVDTYTNYRAIGPNGTTITSGGNGGYNFQSVQGTSRQFNEGERIKVYWYNHGGSAIIFTPRISFTDSDRYDTGSTWYNMNSTTIQPYSIDSIEYVFDNVSEGSYSLVNVNVNYDNTEILICDKIKLIFGEEEVPQYHKADTNHDNLIDMPELMAFIARWKANDGVSKAEVEDARNIWYGGGY